MSTVTRDDTRLDLSFIQSATKKLRNGWNDKIVFREKERHSVLDVGGDLNPGWATLIFHLADQLNIKLYYTGNYQVSSQVGNVLKEAEAFIKILD